MELLLIIAAFWAYRAYKKADEATKQRYRAKLFNTYDRVLNQTQKNFNTDSTPDWRRPEPRQQNEKRPIEINDVVDTPAPRRHYPSTNPDGPTIQRTRRFFGPNYED